MSEMSPDEKRERYYCGMNIFHSGKAIVDLCQEHEPSPLQQIGHLISDDTLIASYTLPSLLVGALASDILLSLVTDPDEPWFIHYIGPPARGRVTSGSIIYYLPLQRDKHIRFKAEPQANDSVWVHRDIGEPDTSPATKADVDFFNTLDPPLVKDMPLEQIVALSALSTAILDFLESD